LTHFHAKVVALENKDLSADQVYETIQEATTAWTTGKLKVSFVLANKMVIS
jgi:hypothetical protein